MGDVAHDSGDFSVHFTDLTKSYEHTEDTSKNILWFKWQKTSHKKIFGSQTSYNHNGWFSVIQLRSPSEMKNG